MRKFIFGILSFLAAVPVLIFTFAYTWMTAKYQIINGLIIVAALIALIIILCHVAKKRHQRAVEAYYEEIPPYTIAKNPTISMKTRK